MSTRLQAEPYPAPWAWEYHTECEDPIALVSRSGDVLLATGDGGAAWVQVSPTHQALLAAAPDLLAAARLAYDTIALHCGYPMDPRLRSAMEALGAAVNKAEG